MSPNIIRLRYFHGTYKRRLTAGIGTSGETISFKLADIGEGIHEVELLKWFVNPNDKVKVFDKLCSVQSDKATVEITSRYEGIIKSLLHEEGAIVKVGDILVDIEIVKPLDALLQNSNTKESISDSSQKETKDLSLLNRGKYKENQDIIKVLASPAVRKIAKDSSIDLQQIIGSGLQGRVLKEDIQKLVTNANSISESNDRKESITKSDNTIPIPPQAVTPADHNVIPIRGVQRVMVNAMTAAAQVKHLTFCDEINVSSLVKLKRQLATDVGNLLSKRNLNSSSNSSPLKISYLPILVKMVSLSLLQFPMLNATVNSSCTEMIHHNQHNISILMDTPKGLVDPVIKRVNEKSIIDIAMDLEQLQVCYYICFVISINIYATLLKRFCFWSFCCKIMCFSLFVCVAIIFFAGRCFKWYFERKRFRRRNL